MTYCEGHLPFMVRDMAEDGEPFSQWDGSTLFTTPVPAGAIKAPSKSSTEAITVYGEGSGYCIPLTIDQVCELYWRMREFTAVWDPVTVSGFGKSVTHAGGPGGIEIGLTGYPAYSNRGWSRTFYSRAVQKNEPGFVDPSSPAFRSLAVTIHEHAELDLLLPFPPMPGGLIDPDAPAPPAPPKYKVPDPSANFSGFYPTFMPLDSTGSVFSIDSSEVNAIPEWARPGEQDRGLETGYGSPNFIGFGGDSEAAGSNSSDADGSLWIFAGGYLQQFCVPYSGNLIRDPSGTYWLNPFSQWFGGETAQPGYFAEGYASSSSGVTSTWGGIDMRIGGFYDPASSADFGPYFPIKLVLSGGVEIEATAYGSRAVRGDGGITGLEAAPLLTVGVSRWFSYGGAWDESTGLPVTG